MFSPSSLFDLFCENEKGETKQTNKKKRKAQKIKMLFLQDWQIGKSKKVNWRLGVQHSASMGWGHSLGPPPANGGLADGGWGDAMRPLKRQLPGAQWLLPSLVWLTTKNGSLFSVETKHHLALTFLRVMLAHPSKEAVVPGATSTHSMCTVIWSQPPFLS